MKKSCKLTIRGSKKQSTKVFRDNKVKRGVADRKESDVGGGGSGKSYYIGNRRVSTHDGSQVHKGEERRRKQDLSHKKRRLGQSKKENGSGVIYHLGHRGEKPKDAFSHGLRNVRCRYKIRLEGLEAGGFRKSLDYNTLFGESKLATTREELLTVGKCILKEGTGLYTLSEYWDREEKGGKEGSGGKGTPYRG